MKLYLCRIMLYNLKPMKCGCGCIRYTKEVAYEVVGREAKWHELFTWPDNIRQIIYNIQMTCLETC